MFCAMLSVTWLATTVSVQTVPAGSGVVGVSVNADAGEAGETLNALGVAAGHSSVKALPVTVTASLKFTVRVALRATAVAPLAGTVLVTDGGVSAGMAPRLVAVGGPPRPAFPSALLLFVMRSFTVTAMSRLVVVGFCDALL